MACGVIIIRLQSFVEGVEAFSCPFSLWEARKLQKLVIALSVMGFLDDVFLSLGSVSGKACFSQADCSLLV